MKFLVLVLLSSTASFAQMPKMPSLAVVKDLAKQVMEACKEDKSKMSGCESYTDLAKLKVCLMANEAKLSDKCKSSLKLVK